MPYWLVFDIETIPDATLGRRWLGAKAGESDAGVRQAMLAARREETGHSDFLKPPFHQVVAIAAALIDETGDIRRLGPLGQASDAEAELVRHFFRIVEEVKPCLVGWNSAAFDLPTLIYRAMRHEIAVPLFYRIGEPYHSYRKRYDEALHLDLMDLLSGYGASARVSLEEAALLVNVPGKLGVDGHQVIELYEAGDLERIRHYCTHDVLTTTLVFAAYAYHRGWLTEETRDRLWLSARRWVWEGPEEVWAPFRAAWDRLRAREL
ncbi:MAG: 3'-5' exonuclease [Firmicutes bacterium]|nr:3'-5' exonuclease [Bacillota bacterium]